MSDERMTKTGQNTTAESRPSKVSPWGHSWKSIDEAPGAAERCSACGIMDDDLLCADDLICLGVADESGARPNAEDDRTCLGCEHFDCGGEDIATAARKSGVPVGGDCLNGWSSPRFETTSDDTCEGWCATSASLDAVGLISEGFHARERRALRLASDLKGAVP